MDPRGGGSGSGYTTATLATQTTTAQDEVGPIVLFDGVCNFCEGSVRFVLERDRRAHFRFAALQSEAGRARLRRVGLSADHIEGLVVVDGSRVYTKSGAALRVARGLPGAWPLLWIFYAVPAVLRDAVYDAFATRRYRWFGRRDSCLVPSAEVRARFLD